MAGAFSVGPMLQANVTVRVYADDMGITGKLLMVMTCDLALVFRRHTSRRC